MITTGSTRGKCSAEQLGQRRDQPPRTMSVEWPQLAQKRWRVCQRERLSPAANSGASPSARIARRGNAAQGAPSASWIAEKRGLSPSSPRNSSGVVTGCQARRPSAVSSGRPLDHLSSRASLRPASAAMAAASPRNASARSRPAPLKKGSGGKAPPACQRGCRRLAVKRRETGFGEAIERLPPTLADRLSAALETEFEAEVGEDVRHLDRRGQWPPGSAAMPPSRPFSGRRTSHTEPSRSIHQAMPCRTGRALLVLTAGKVSGAPEA